MNFDGLTFLTTLVLEKDVFRLVTSLGQEKNFESPRGIEPQTFGFRAPILSLIFIYKHDSIDIADPCNMQENRVVESLWLSGMSIGARNPMV